MDTGNDLSSPFLAAGTKGHSFAKTYISLKYLTNTNFTFSAFHPYRSSLLDPPPKKNTSFMSYHSQQEGRSNWWVWISWDILQNPSSFRRRPPWLVNKNRITLHKNSTKFLPNFQNWLSLLLIAVLIFCSRNKNQK